MKTFLADKSLCSLLFDVEACSVVLLFESCTPCLSVLSLVTVVHRRIESYVTTFLGKTSQPVIVDF